ncbi:rhodanese-like domain-containing protein [Streptomyces althioticus]|uniref:rhodanese-like domain-containing protein n=1 Tax=Streptomyces althioticus TaxID=83380 RepID=UPI0037B54AF9
MPRTVDVRQEAEFAAGHVPGAVHIELGAPNDSAADAPAGPLVACRHSERATTAASLLQRAGHTGIAGTSFVFGPVHAAPRSLGRGTRG